jgi:hypothetical protein
MYQTLDYRYSGPERVGKKSAIKNRAFAAMHTILKYGIRNWICNGVRLAGASGDVVQSNTDEDGIEFPRPRDKSLLKNES